MRCEIASLGQEYTGPFNDLQPERGEANLLAVALDKSRTEKPFQFLDSAR
jgi:hypothetical protein